MRICLSLAVAVSASQRTAAAADDFPSIFTRATAYVAEFTAQFAAVIWHDEYEQVDRLPIQFGASGARFTRAGRRRLESEMLFIPADANATWLQEWYGYVGSSESRPEEGISCTAKYSDFRRFETSGRIVP